MQAYAFTGQDEAFAASQTQFTTMVAWLGDEHNAGMTHAQVEERLHTEGLELLRRMFQDRLDLHAAREQRLEDVRDADGVPRGGAEYGRERSLATRFGPVEVARIAYRGRGQADLHPADAVLNLPVEKHSHGLRRLAALEAARGSFADAAAAIQRATGVGVGTRQAQQLTARAAADVDAFYTARAPTPAPVTDVLVMTFDGKGVVMRPEGLREPTAKAAASRKLSARLSRGEKGQRKRMAEIAGVYDLTPLPRSIADILPEGDGQRDATRCAPAARGKWLTASVTDNAAQVITAGFDEATRRDPRQQRAWIALVDGNRHQIDRIRAEARARHLTVAIVIDFIHVVEYLWRAAWCFFPEGDPHAQAWVRGHARQVLAGRAGIVAAAIRRKATRLGLGPSQRKAVDTAATYLLNKKPWLDYPTALARGWPIATGVIEGACRYLVKDRLDITGARWGLDGAEAVLKLRALISNGDFEDYWHWHLEQEHQRVHKARYNNGVIPTR